MKKLLTVSALVASLAVLGATSPALATGTDAPLTKTECVAKQPEVKKIVPKLDASTMLRLCDITVVLSATIGVGLSFTLPIITGLVSALLNIGGVTLDLVLRILCLR